MTHYRTFSRRYLFQGRLELLTGMHVGGGRATLSPTDSPVVRTPEGNPFIPGSSLKGAFRNSVERLCTSVPGVWSCGMADDQGCVGVQGEAYREFNRRRADENWNDTRLLRELEGKVCDTCLLFGSLFIASKMLFDDLYLIESGEAVVQVRDGVAIDRDSEKAVDKLKYDYEVVPASQNFSFRGVLEEPNEIDLGLACVGISEYVAGFGHVGGKRSRGLGKCRLVDLTVYELDLTVADSAEKGRRLKRYLTGRTAEEKMSRVSDIDRFMAEKIEGLVNSAARREGGDGAQKHI
jgi:CRISPR-associated RAMP protein (TIGR02581 family)